MPRERIERAIKAGQPGGDDKSTYENLRFEGYGPGRVALIIEVLTDNRNRTGPELRTLFSKGGGTLGEQNSVAFQFSQVGQVVYPVSVASSDAVMEAAIEAGAQDVESNDSQHTVFCAVTDFGMVSAVLEAKFGEPLEAKLVWRPNMTVSPGGEEAASLMKLLDGLDDHDDVQAVYGNYEFSDEVLAALIVG
jgi:YebC/PmpR family DNA-binding regulatory protein